MNRLSARYCVMGVVVFFAFSVASPSWGQKGGGGGKGGGTGSSGSGSGPSAPSTAPPVSSGPVQPSFNALSVRGRILMDSGQPVPEPVSVGLRCGMRSLQVIHSDLKGYFEFSLGTGAQSNMDMSASDDGRFSGGPGGVPSGAGGMQSVNGQTNGFAGRQDVLTGCEVQVNVSGYVPMSTTITGRTDITGIDVGTMQLTRIAGVTGSSISVTSLQVPDDARKEFEKGEKDARSNHMGSATQHLEKAVARYDKYAAAWNDLGSLYAAGHATEKSRAAFQKAIEADPHYVPPYLGLAQLEMQNQEIEPAVDTAGKALELDSSIGIANYIQAVGDLKLNRLDAADKSAQMAEKVPHGNIPDLHALHASILLQKRDYPGASAQMRAYLKEFPQGRFADQMKKDLQQIESAGTGGDSKSASSESQIAP